MGELGWNTELGDAWNVDRAVWDGIEIGISSRGEVVSGSSRSAAVDAMGRRNWEDSCSRGTCEESARTEGAAVRVLAETASNCSVDTLVVVAGGRNSGEGWNVVAADVLGDDGEGVRAAGELDGDGRVTALDELGAEGLGSSNTSVDCGNPNPPSLLKTTGGTAELTGNTTEATTLLSAAVLLLAVAVVSTWGRAEMLLGGRGRRSTVWLDIMNCSDSDSSGMSWLVAVASGVGVVRGEGVPG